MVLYALYCEAHKNIIKAAYQNEVPKTCIKSQKGQGWFSDFNPQ